MKHALIIKGGPRTLIQEYALFDDAREAGEAWLRGQVRRYSVDTTRRLLEAWANAACTTWVFHCSGENKLTAQVVELSDEQIGELG